jgi:hypothetical protein
MAMASSGGDTSESQRQGRSGPAWRLNSHRGKRCDISGRAQRRQLRPVARNGSRHMSHWHRRKNAWAWPQRSLGDHGAQGSSAATGQEREVARREPGAATGSLRGGLSRRPTGFKVPCLHLTLRHGHPGIKQL